MKKIDELRQPEPELHDSPDKSPDVYLLGGGDHEMSRVRKRLGRAGLAYIDKELPWERASIDEYGDEITGLLDAGKTPVAVELRGADSVPGVVDIDHHNEKSGRPSSIMQVLERAGLDLSLADRLAGANDAEYYSGMDRVVEEKVKALREKLSQDGYDEAFISERAEGVERWLRMMVERVRRQDRELQGVTDDMEQEAEAAIAQAEHGPGGMVIVRLNGGRPSPVTDRLHYTWPEGKENLVVVCNEDKERKEVWFFGRGSVSSATKDHFLSMKLARLKGGDTSGSNEYHAWGGGVGFGKEDQSAFCGVVASNPQEVIDFIISQRVV